MIFAIILATLINTDWFGYYWGNGSAGWPSWMPHYVSSANTPGSQNYDPPHRLTADNAAAFYASLDGWRTRLDAHGDAPLYYDITTRRLINYDKFNSMRYSVKHGIPTVSYRRWSSSAFDYNYRGHPTYSKLAVGSFSDFGWTSYPLGKQVHFTDLAGFGDLDTLNEKGILPYSTAEFIYDASGLGGETTEIPDVFRYLTYGEDYDSPYSTPNMLSNISTNFEKYGKYDLSMDEMINVMFGTDPRNINMDTHRMDDSNTNQFALCNQAMSLYDRQYHLHTQRPTLFEYEQWDYYGRIPAAEPQEITIKWSETEGYIGGLPSKINLEAGDITNVVRVATGTCSQVSSRFRVTPVRAGMSLSLTAKDTFSATINYPLTVDDLHYLSGFSGGKIEYSYTLDDPDSSTIMHLTIREPGSTNVNEWAHDDYILGYAAEYPESGDYNVYIDGAAGCSYSVQRTLRGTNDIEVDEFPLSQLDRYRSGSNKARMFESMLSTDQDECFITNDIRWVNSEEHDFGSARYRAKTQSYTTSNTLITVINQCNDTILEEAKAEAAQYTGSSAFYVPDRYSDFSEQDFYDALDKGYSATIGWSFIGMDGQGWRTNEVWWSQEKQRWEGDNAVVNYQIKGTIELEQEWSETSTPKRVGAAVDTKRKIISEANFKFPVQKSVDGTIYTVGSEREQWFCNPIVSETEHQDQYTGTSATVVSGDEPVYYVCKSGFEGAWSNSYWLTEARFSYLTNVEERAFAYAFANCSSFCKLWMPALVHAGTNAFERAFKNTALTNVCFQSLECAHTECFKDAFAGCSELKSVEFPALTYAGEAAFSPLDSDYTLSSITNIDLGALKNAEKKAFYQAFQVYGAVPNLSKLVLTNLENAAEDSFDQAFYSNFRNTQLEDICMPNLTNAGRRAFYQAWMGARAITNFNFTSLRTAGYQSFYQALKSVNYNLFTDTGFELDLPSLEIAGEDAFRDVIDYDTMYTLRSVNLPKLTNCNIYAFYNPDYRNHWDSWETNVRWLDMRSLKYLDCRYMDFCNNAENSATRIVARLDNVEDTLGDRSCRWPRTFSTADEIYFTKADPMWGKNVFYSDEYTLPWDCVVHVPTNKVATWKSSSYWSDYAWQIAGGEDDYMVCKPFPDNPGDTFVVTCRCSEVGLTAAKFGSNLTSTSVSGATEYEDGYYRVSYSGKPKGEEFNPYFVNADGEEVYGHTTYPQSFEILTALRHGDIVNGAQQVDFELKKFNVADTNYYATLCDSSYNQVGSWTLADAWDIGEHTITGMVTLGSSEYNITNYPYMKMRCGTMYANHAIDDQDKTSILKITGVTDNFYWHTIYDSTGSYRILTFRNFTITQQKNGTWPSSVVGAELRFVVKGTTGIYVTSWIRPAANVDATSVTVRSTDYMVNNPVLATDKAIGEVTSIEVQWQIGVSGRVLSTEYYKVR